MKNGHAKEAFFADLESILSLYNTFQCEHGIWFPRSFCIIHSHGRAQTSLKQRFGFFSHCCIQQEIPKMNGLYLCSNIWTDLLFPPFVDSIFREGSLLDIQPGFLFPRVLIVLKLIPLILSRSLAVSPPSPSKQLALLFAYFVTHD